MKNKAASAQNNGAAFAAFRKNLELLLNKHELRIVVTDDLEHLSHDLFLFWELGMQAYFENLPRVGISLSAETNTRWLSQAMVIEIGDSDGRTPPEECGVLLEYGKRFFSIFFREHGGGSDNGGEKGKSHFLSSLPNWPWKSLSLYSSKRWPCLLRLVPTDGARVGLRVPRLSRFLCKESEYTDFAEAIWFGAGCFMAGVFFYT